MKRPAAHLRACGARPCTAEAQQDGGIRPSFRTMRNISWQNGPPPHDLQNIEEIEDQIKRVAMIPQGPDAAGKVQIGSEVVLKDDSAASAAGEENIQDPWFG